MLEGSRAEDDLVLGQSPRNREDKSAYDQLLAVEDELDLVKCAEGIEDDLLEASLEEYQ